MVVVKFYSSSDVADQPWSMQAEEIYHIRLFHFDHKSLDLNSGHKKCAGFSGEDMYFRFVLINFYCTVDWYVFTLEPRDGSSSFHPGLF